MNPQVGVFIVSGHAVHQFRSPSVRADRTTAASSGSFFISGKVMLISDSPAFEQASYDEDSESNRDGLGCIRGLRSALLLEVGIGVLTYGFWHLWHLAR
jgi:hypothetical protein